MTNEEINQSIVEMTGECWHKLEVILQMPNRCIKCRKYVTDFDYVTNPDYCSSFDDIIPLIQDLRENKKIWASLFDEIFIDYDSDSVASLAIWIGDLTPLQLSEAVYKALKENEK